MTASEFEAHVAKNAKEDLDFNYAVIGLCGEAGEVAEWHKKVNLRKVLKSNLGDIDLLSELGDVLYYLTRAANLKGWSLEHVMEYNQLKLQKRRRDETLVAMQIG